MMLGVLELEECFRPAFEVMEDGGMVDEESPEKPNENVPVLNDYAAP